MHPKQMRQLAGMSVKTCAVAVKCNPATWQKLEDGILDLPEIRAEVKRRIDMLCGGYSKALRK